MRPELPSKVVLYGQEVFPNGDPLKVVIPQAFSDEAMEKVKKLLQNLPTPATSGGPTTRPHDGP